MDSKILFSSSVIRSPLANVLVKSYEDFYNADRMTFEELAKSARTAAMVTCIVNKITSDPDAICDLFPNLTGEERCLLYGTS